MLPGWGKIVYPNYYIYVYLYIYMYLYMYMYNILSETVKTITASSISDEWHLTASHVNTACHISWIKLLLCMRMTSAPTHRITTLVFAVAAPCEYYRLATSIDFSYMWLIVEAASCLYYCTYMKLVHNYLPTHTDCTKHYSYVKTRNPMGLAIVS